MDITYRKYKKNDKKDIEVLAKKLVIIMAITNPLRLKIPKEDYAKSWVSEIEGTLEKNEGVIIVAEAEKKIVGYCYGFVIKREPDDLLEMKHKKVGQIEDLIVLEKFQKFGIGSELLKRVESALKIMGCEAFVLHTVPDSLASKIYKKRGYKSNLVEMCKVIEAYTDIQFSDIQ